MPSYVTSRSVPKNAEEVLIQTEENTENEELIKKKTLSILQKNRAIF